MTGPGTAPHINPSLEKSEVAANNSFNTHTVDNRFAEMQLNTDLVEEAKLAAKQK